MKITDIRGQSHVFTLTNGKTLRLFSRQTTNVNDSLISAEMRMAARLGVIRMTKEKTPPPPNPKNAPNTQHPHNQKPQTETKKEGES